MNDELYSCYSDNDLNLLLNTNSKKEDIVLLPLFGFFIMLFLLETALLVRLPYLLRRFYICGKLTKDEKKENKVTIVRGVPGSGKTYYVYHLEKERDGEFALCNWNDYFVDGEGNYKFKGSELGRAEQQSRLKFIRAISEKVKRIYVVGYFNEEWMYYEYEKLAKVSGYNVEIVDIECSDHRHLMHFNKRSQHNTPYTKSLKCFDNWEYYETNTRQEPYIENFPGDVIPSYGVVTRSQLDKQLDDYNKNKGKPKCLIQTDSDSESEKDAREYSDVFIEFIDPEQKTEILSREFYERYLEQISDPESDSESELDEKTSSEEGDDLVENKVNTNDEYFSSLKTQPIELDYEYIEGYGTDNESMTNE